jgi:ubiquinone/menaquinone biosynthesis C-methylase UbiE
MADVWATVAEQDAATQERLADVLETRGAEAKQQELRRAFLSGIDFPADARVLEIGCGTGVLTRRLATWPRVSEVVGVDVAPSLLERARELSAPLATVTFQEADARDLPFADASFDVVVFDSTLTHVPGPEQALEQAARVLRPAGLLAAFDGDYSTTTVALHEHDVLQTCVEAMVDGSVHDRWLVRRLPSLVRRCGLEVLQLASHGYVDTEGAYMLTIVDRGVDLLVAAGTLARDTADALKAEGRRRVESGTFYGFIAYGSLVGRKPKG